MRIFQVFRNVVILGTLLTGGVAFASPAGDDLDSLLPEAANAEASAATAAEKKKKGATPHKAGRGGKRHPKRKAELGSASG